MMIRHNVDFMEETTMFKGFFDLDGPFNRFGTFAFDMIALNLLWFIFSIPIFTVGASTTALFYVLGKKIRNEDGYIWRDFWKSFKLNFRQSTIIWLLMLIVFSIARFNLNSSHLFGSMGKALVVFQYAILLQMIFISIYIFPLLSRFYLTIAGAIKMAFFVANRHLLTTIICILLFVATLFITWVASIFIFVAVSLYAISAAYFIEKILVKYMPEKEGSSLEETASEE